MTTSLLLFDLVSMTLIVAIRYLVVSGGFALWTTRRGIVAGPADPARRRIQISREVRYSLASAVIYAVPAGIVLALWRREGLTAIQTEWTTAGMIWWPFSVALYLFLHDSWFYWTHRAMHSRRLFPKVHAVHHASKPPTAWAAMSFHPWEAMSGAVLIPALAMVIPIHWTALGVVLTVATVMGVTNHMGWEMFPGRWVHGWLGRHVITASHHEAHHRHYNCNYGLYFRFWDRRCGTDRGLVDFGSTALSR